MRVRASYGRTSDRPAALTRRYAPANLVRLTPNSPRAGGAEWPMTGPHDGDFPGLPATHKSFTVRGASGFALAGDKIRHHRAAWDFATLRRQIGRLPEPAPA